MVGVSTGRYVRLWLCYAFAWAALRLRSRPVRQDPARQAEADEAFRRLLDGVFDDWQRRQVVLRDDAQWAPVEWSRLRLLFRRR